MESLLADTDMKAKLDAVIEDELDAMSDVSISTNELLRIGLTGPAEKAIPGFVNTRVTEASEILLSLYISPVK